LFAFLLIPALVAAQALAPVSPFAVRYRALVDAYRTGAPDAVRSARELDLHRLDAIVDEYVGNGQRSARSPSLDADFLHAASMLHADAAFQCWENFGMEGCGAHLDIARRFVDVSEAAGTRGAFRRRWYAATALILTRHVAPEAALKYFDGAIAQLPDDVPLLTAAGWFAERLSRSAAPPNVNLRNAQELRQGHEQRAARFLEAALAVDPRAAEASLRLARIEVSSGKREAALNRLAALLVRADIHKSVAYVARLTLGSLRERDGNRIEAERLYREAIPLDPVAQSARVALTHLLYAAGDGAGAADAIDPVLARNTPEANDAWPDYQLAYPGVGQVLLDQLRAEVRR